MSKKLTNETSFRIVFKQKTKRYWMLVSGYWILKGNYPYFILAKDGIFDPHQVSSSLHRFASPTVYVAHQLVGLRRSFAILMEYGLWVTIPIAKYVYSVIAFLWFFLYRQWGSCANWPPRRRRYLTDRRPLLHCCTIPIVSEAN